MNFNLTNMRLIGVNIPDNKRVEIALTYLYGISRSSANKILAVAKVDVSKHAKDLNPVELKNIKEIIDKTYKN